MLIHDFILLQRHYNCLVQLPMQTQFYKPIYRGKCLVQLW